MHVSKTSGGDRYAVFMNADGKILTKVNLTKSSSESNIDNYRTISTLYFM